MWLESPTNPALEDVALPPTVDESTSQSVDMSTFLEAPPAGVDTDLMLVPR